MTSINEAWRVENKATASKHFTVVGGGLAGALMAVILRRRGYAVTIYERYGDLRTIPSAGRSINLVLTARGLQAIKEIGGPLLRDMHTMSTPVMGRVMHQVDGSTTAQRYGKDDSEYNLSISRYELNCYLLNKAEEAGAVVKFGHALTNVDFFNGSQTHSVLEFQTGGREGPKHVVSVNGPVIGADGAGSTIRNALRDQGAIEYEDDFCVQGYKEILFPLGKAIEGLDRNGLHIWPRDTHFIMGLANLDGSFTGTIYVDAKGGAESFEGLNTRERIIAFFEKYYPTAIEMLGGFDAIVPQMLENPVGLLGTVYAASYNLGAKCVLLGDAAHAITPFFGQGTNCSFEDCLVLSQLLDAHVGADGADWTRQNLALAFARFSETRKVNADAIAQMALENFVEMREKVGDVKFNFLKSMESILENTFPDQFRSRYAMVCYGGGGGITYDAALKLGAVQWTILEELYVGLKEPQDVDLARAEALIHQRLVPAQDRMGVDLRGILHTVLPEDASQAKL